MDIKILFSGDEYSSRKFYKFHLNHFTFIKKFFIIFEIVLLVLMILSITVRITGGLLILLVLVIVLIPFIYLALIRSLVNKSSETRKTYDQEIKFTDNLIIHSYANIENSYSYMSLYRVCDLRDYIYLYLDNDRALIVPKKQIKTDEVNELVDYLKRNVNVNVYKKYYKKP